VTVRDRAGRAVRRPGDDPLAVVEALAADHGAGDTVAGPVPVAIGYLGYDLARVYERLPAPRRSGDALPDLWFGIYGAVWRHDAATGVAEVVGPDPRARAELAARLAARDPRPSPAVTGTLIDADDPDGAGYRARLARVLDYIGAGDVYQVNLARRLVAPLGRDGDLLSLYRTLAAHAPSAYGALIETGTARLLSASPERFLSRPAGSRRVETRPIKGTRRRTGDPARDHAVRAELRADAKERAEHLMIVDLERNDLGRVAELGSVKVDSFARVVELPTLYHMVSTVSCRVREGVGTAALVRATFPSGSITGAPKLRAMEIIDELEPVRRGPYTGAIGYLGQGGAVELSIAIRTAIVTSGALEVHVGGGIVADSNAARELEETEEKAAAWRRAIAAARAVTPPRPAGPRPAVTGAP
jgi:para-aminobenzoate synthetase component 1